MKTCRNPSGRCLYHLPGLEGKHLISYYINHSAARNRLHSLILTNTVSNRLTSSVPICLSFKLFAAGPR